MERPAVDVVLPVAGDVAAAVRVLAGLVLRPGDTATVVDNRGAGGGAGRDEVFVAAQVPSSYHARNAGAARGTAPWIVFLDADVEPVADLLDRYFAAPVPDEVAVLAGGIVDGPGGRAAQRYARRRASMSHETVLAHGPWAFAQTANAAVRRSAFLGVGGFEAGVRSGGDADLCFRLRAAGWTLEPRPDALVVHHNRASLAALLRQRARHGAGAAWLARRWPGAFPARPPAGLALWTLRCWARAAVALTRRESDAALMAAIDPLAVWAFELGRRRSNEARSQGRSGRQ